jgi:hypothetical protein
MLMYCFAPRQNNDAFSRQSESDSGMNIFSLQNLLYRDSRDRGLRAHIAHFNALSEPTHSGKAVCSTGPLFRSRYKLVYGFNEKSVPSGGLIDGTYRFT